MRTRHSREAFATLQRARRAQALRRRRSAPSIAYAEAAERAVSILDHRPDLGADYLALADEILERLKMPDARARLKALADAA